MLKKWLRMGFEHVQVVTQKSKKFNSGKYFFILSAKVAWFSNIFCSGRCGSCGVPICSEKCIEQSAHLLECDLINEDFQAFGILTPLRFLASKSKFPEDYRKMSGLVGHLEMKKSGPDWQNISAMADTLEQFNIPEVNRQDIEEAICILNSNSYQLLHQSGTFLNGVFIVASMFNHVCYQANSRPSFGKNHAMKVIATGMKNSLQI